MSPTRRVVRILTAALAAVLLLIASALPAWAAEAMTVTFVRHGQSEANAANVLNTAVPGPGLTPLGHQQAQTVAALLAAEAHDGIYASTMIRSQQTALPLSAATSTPVTVLPGLQEISGGVFEGGQERGVVTLLGYGGPPLAWTLGLRAVPILGSSDTGNSFDARVDGALQTIYDSGDRAPVVFAHGGTIMFWVMMNVDNPDPFLILTRPLDNTDVVVVDGNSEDGWTLTSWAGRAIDPNPSLVTRVFVVVRDVLAAVSGAAAAPPPVTPALTTNPVPVQRTATPASVPAEPEPEQTRRPTKDTEPTATSAQATPNGATDLSNGNKVEPGTVHSEDEQAEGADPEREPEIEPEADSTEPTTPEPTTETSAAEGDSEPAAA